MAGLFFGSIIAFGVVDDMLSRHELREGGEEVIKQASAMTAESFVNYPSYVEIFRGDEAFRAKNMAFMMERNISWLCHASPSSMYSFNKPGSKDIECFYMLSYNDSCHLTLKDKIRYGLWQMPFRCGFDAMQRLLHCADYMQRLELETMREYPVYLVLQRLVVCPTARRRGVGSQCLDVAFNVADCEQLPIFLVTQLLSNVKFYSRL
jgi:ribosomal protein S18 acetylase RimI-like enzyme